MYVQRTCGKTPRQNVGCFYMHAIKNYFFLGFFFGGGREWDLLCEILVKKILGG